MQQTTTFEIAEIKKINRIINNLYDIEVPLQNRLLQFISDLHPIVYSDRTDILFFQKNAKDEYRVHSAISVNFDTKKKILKTYDSFNEQVGSTLPFIDSNETVLFSANSYFKKNAAKKKNFWSGFLLPHNNLYAIEGNVHIASEKLRCGFILYRDNEGIDFNEKEVAVMSLLQPHLSNLLWYYGDRSDNTDFFFMLTNYECVGFATFDEDLKVTTCNDCYTDLVSGPVYDDDDKEIPNYTRNVIDSLCKELYDNLKPEEINDSLERKVPGAPYYVVISISKANKATKAEYTCMIYDLSYIYNEDLSDFDTRTDMTAEEFDILKDVLAGYSNDEIAASRALALPAIEKALTSIYRKIKIGWDEDEDE